MSSLSHTLVHLGGRLGQDADDDSEGGARDRLDVERGGRHLREAGEVVEEAGLRGRIEGLDGGGD
eukprot:5852769-Prymnesium_polylepis.1